MASYSSNLLSWIQLEILSKRVEEIDNKLRKAIKTLEVQQLANKQAKSNHLREQNKIAKRGFARMNQILYFSLLWFQD